jgi:hypothetical protein
MALRECIMNTQWKKKEQNGKGKGVHIELKPLIKIKWLPYLITLSPYYLSLSCDGDY